MRALIQRVREASVVAHNRAAGSCGRGLVILLGIGPNDTEALAQGLWDKIAHLRIFGDDAGKMNRSLIDVAGEALIVSQFTLYADCRHGRRPFFAGAAAPSQAEALYEWFCQCAKADCPHVGCGVFGADMRLSLVNDGPVTIWLDTDELIHGRSQSTKRYSG